MIEIVQLLASPLHRYEGRPADGPLPAPPGELVESIEVQAGLGVVGDRYFGKRAHRLAAVTVVSADAIAGADLLKLRRNIMLRGADVDSWVGSTVALDTGSGPIVLRVHRPARPCAWMDAVFGAGARRTLRDHGGVRCEPMTSGRLQLGPVRVEVLETVPA